MSNYYEDLYAQISEVKNCLDRKVHKLHEINNLNQKCGDSDYLFSVIGISTHLLIEELKKHIYLPYGQRKYRIRAEKQKQISETYLKKNFDNRLHNRLEDLIFISYLYLAFAEFMLGKKDAKQSLKCLCNASKLIGFISAPDDEILANTIKEHLVSREKSLYATIKHNKLAEQIKPIREQVLHLWNKNINPKNGRGWSSFAECANHFYLQQNDPSLSVRTLISWISSYQKSKPKCPFESTIC